MKSIRNPKCKVTPKKIRVAKTSRPDPNEKGGMTFIGEHISKMWEARRNTDK